MEKIKIYNEKVWGFRGALRGMRNPMMSHSRADSSFEENGEVIIGENDLFLCKRLIRSGSEHAKFLRFIHVQAEFKFPRYFWSECDTYKFFEKNSESTMHKLLNNPYDINLDQFVFDDEDIDLITSVVSRLNEVKKAFESTTNQKEKDKLLARAKRILPEGFIQVRTIDTNYQELWNMYKQRVIVSHRLKESWVDTFGKWCESLPYFKEFFLD
ncbi:hypothetical protein AALA22_13015 [Anaerovoracaceae bacterium 41-7]